MFIIKNDAFQGRHTGRKKRYHQYIVFITNNSKERIESTLEFLENIIHTIIFKWAIYDPGMFKQQRIYNIPLWRSIHPTLNDYIYKSIISLRNLLTNGQIAKVKIRYLRHSTLVEEVIIPLNAIVPHDEESCAPILVEDINMYYRSIILSLENCISAPHHHIHKRHSDNSTFELSLLLIEGRPIIIEDLYDEENGFHWILDDADADYLSTLPAAAATEGGGSQIIPVKSYTTSQFNIEVFLKKYRIN